MKGLKEISPLNRLNELNEFSKTIYEANPDNAPKYFMNLNDPEVKTFLTALHEHQVKYMIVGGVALVFHGHVRTTQDIDLWIQESPTNKRKLVDALKSIGVPGADHYLTVEMVPGWSSLKIGDRGFVADLMGYLKNFEAFQFDECYERAIQTDYQGVPITVISRQDLIEEKKKTARGKDLDDLEHLQKQEKKSKEEDGSTDT